MGEKLNNLGAAAVDLAGQMGVLAIKQSYDSGEYITMYGGVNRKVNKWGMEWPVGNLDTQTVESYVRDSTTIPLRKIVAKHLVKEADELWTEKRPDGYGTEPNFRRTIPDVAINEGYLKVGEAILYPDILYPNLDIYKNEPVSKSSLEIDPTGIDWLNEKLNDLALVWNDIHQHMPEFDTPEDPAVMGMRAAIERYKDLYTELVRRGAKKDESPNRVQQTSLRIKRGVNNQIQTTGLRILESISRGMKHSLK